MACDFGHSFRICKTEAMSTLLRRRQENAAEQDAEALFHT